MLNDKTKLNLLNILADKSFTGKKNYLLIIFLLFLTLEPEANEIDRIINTNNTDLSYQIKYFANTIMEKPKTAYTYVSPRVIYLVF